MTKRSRARAAQWGWREEGQSLVRAIAAGAIVGVPLLYTMEMWWRGMTALPHHLLILLGVILLVNFLFGFLSGFRPESSVAEAVSESVTAVGVGLLFSAAVLWLIGEITFEASWLDILGRILMETAGVSIGIMFANSQVRNRSRRGSEASAGKKAAHERSEDADWLQLKQDLRDLAATLVGATVLAMSIAPTEEVVMIASRLPPWHLLVLMAASLGLCYVILFASGFQQQRAYVQSFFQHPSAETLMAYALSLLVAFLLLYLVGSSEATISPSMTVASTVTLGLPAVIGGAAGRLIA